MSAGSTSLEVPHMSALKSALKLCGVKELLKKIEITPVSRVYRLIYLEFQFLLNSAFLKILYVQVTHEDCPQEFDCSQV